MLFVSLECLERVRRYDDDDDDDEYDINMETRNERRHMGSLLKKKKKDAHPYGRWVKLKEVRDALLRRIRKKRRLLPLPMYETVATESKHVDTGIQTYDLRQTATMAAAS
jgi:hypothetical protein